LDRIDPQQSKYAKLRSDALKVFKYGLSNECLRIKPNNRLIWLLNRELAFKAGLYLTPDQFDEPIVARHVLATTYSPRFRFLLQIDFDLNTVIDNEGVRIAERSDLHALPRIWPAFGEPGGSHEAILIEKEGVKLSPRKTAHFRAGGELGKYTFDDVNEYSPDVLEALAKAVYAILSHQDMFELTWSKDGVDMVVGRITDYPGVTFHAQAGNKQCSISIGLADYDRLLKIAFWGYVWIDIANGLRRLYGPLFENCDFAKSRNEVATELKDPQSEVYRDLNAILRMFCSRLSFYSSEPFFNHNSLTSFLPR
jgi:hypothetical protein